MSDKSAEYRNEGKLLRSRNNRMIAGVLAGLAENQGWNAGFTRTTFVVLPFLASMMRWEIGAGFIAIYLLAWFLIPNANYALDDNPNDQKFISNRKDTHS